MIGETIAVATSCARPPPTPDAPRGRRCAPSVSRCSTREGWRPGPDWAHLRYLGGYALEPGEDPAVLFRRVEFFQTETAAPVRPRD